MKKSYSTLAIEGAKAVAAINCMAREKIMPEASAGHDYLNRPGVIVSSGSVTVQQDAEYHATGRAGSSNSRLDADTPGLFTKGDTIATFVDSVAVTKETKAFGPAADEMREKARSCAFRSVGIEP